MYKITYIHDGSATENSLYIPGDEDYCLLSYKLSLAMGVVGSLTMEIPYTNPAKDDIACLTDEIIFYRNNVELFRGRAITAQGDFNRTGMLECEGILAYLYDTWYPPYDFNGSPNDLIADVLAKHNAKVEERKRLYVGTITVTDPNDYISRSNQDYSRCLDVLQDKLVGEYLGGYLRVRYQEGKRYLDYLDNYGGESAQPIEFGYNLLDLATDINYGNVVTALLPLGAEVEETTTDADGNEITTTKRVTVESVNGGNPYISDSEAVAQYGWIADCVTWDDVTLPENLLTKAQTYLATVTSGIRTVTVKAVDMALVEPSVTSIFLGDAVHISSPPHGIDLTAELTEMEIGLNPEQNTLTFGTVERLSDIVHRNQSNAVTLVQTERKNRQTAMERLSKAISEGSGLYITPEEQTDGSEIYYLHDQPQLTDSTYVIRVNSQSFAFSTDGGETYPFGYTVDGAMVMEIIQANGINADWVIFGEQTIANVIDDLQTGTASLGTKLQVVEDNIKSKIWKSDITEVTDPIGEKVTTLQDQYTVVDQTLDAIDLTVGNLQTKVASNGSSIDDVKSQLTIQADQIKSKVSKNGVISEINQTAETVTISANRINLTDVFAQSITASGTIKGLTLNAATGSFSGKITAGSGTIGGWTIKSDGLYYTTSHGTVALHPAGSDNVIEVTSTDSDSVARHFYVDSYGIIDATAARIAELSLSYLDGETAGVLSPNSADFGSGIRCSSNLVIEGTHSDSRINRIYMYNGATASPSILQPDFTNLFGVAEGAPSGQGGLGYIEDARMAVSNLTVGATFDDSKLTAQSGYYTTYYLPCKVGDTVRFSGFWPNQNSNTVISFWDASFKLLSRCNGNYFVPNATYNASNAYNVTIDTTAGTWQIVIPSTNHTGTSLASTAYIRVCFNGVAAPRRTFVATCNETITYTKLSHTRWASIALGYENGTSDGFISNLMLHGNGDIDADGSLELGGVITLKGRRIYWNSPVDNGDLALSCKWKDGSNHGILMRGADGLTTTVGWAGNSSYASILNLTSRTVKYTNSSGATSLSDERFKMNWGDLTAYDSFFDALKPQKFQYIDGSSGRYHLGFSAQAVESALAACDLSGADFAGLVRYEVPLEDESWRGYSQEYGLIYTEFVALLVDQVQKLKARVKALEGAA